MSLSRNKDASIRNGNNVNRTNYIANPVHVKQSCQKPQGKRM